MSVGREPSAWVRTMSFGGNTGRARRGDVRTALLLLLAEEPRKGYELMNVIDERSGGAWRPSPGAVYPTLARLRDERLATSRDEDRGRVFEITEAGRLALASRDPALAPPWERLRQCATTGLPDLRAGLERLASAVLVIERVGSAEQRSSAAEHLAQARRAMYQMLADDEADRRPEPG